MFILKSLNNDVKYIFKKKKFYMVLQRKSTAYFHPETCLTHITLCKNDLVPKKETIKKWQGLT